MATPDTASYMTAGYAVIFILLAAYAISLAARWKANISKIKPPRGQDGRDHSG